MSHHLKPFPDLTERMLAALYALAAFARGGGAAEEILASGEILPRIWDLTTIADPDLSWDTWNWLDSFVVWLNSQHAWYSADHTPACWPEHPPLIRELGTLAFDVAVQILALRRLAQAARHAELEGALRKCSRWVARQDRLPDALGSLKSLVRDVPFHMP